MFKNMKIAITPEQPLDEVVKELERLGYKIDFTTNCKPFFVETERIKRLNGWVYSVRDEDDFDEDNLTTLTQLKEMK